MLIHFEKAIANGEKHQHSSHNTNTLTNGGTSLLQPKRNQSQTNNTINISILTVLSVEVNISSKNELRLNKIKVMGTQQIKLQRTSFN